MLPQQATLNPGTEQNILVELWWLRMCFLFVTVCSGSIFKPHTHPVTAQRWNTETKTERQKEYFQQQS